MNAKPLGYLTASAIALCAGCDSSVFDTTPASARDASADASSSHSDAGAGQSVADAGSKQAPGGTGGTGIAATGMSMLPIAAGGSNAEPAPEESKCKPSCSAEHARGTCKDGKCAFSCDSGRGDCNNDLHKAAQGEGDGCETTLADSNEHCGACDRRCRAADGALAQCLDAKCHIVSLTDEAGQMLSAHGTPIDNVTTQLCHAGSVITGIEGFVVDSLIADSIRIICSPLTLSGDPSAPNIVVGKASVPVLEYAGGVNRDHNSQNPTPVPYKLSCGAGEVVRELRISVWAHWGDANGQRYETIKDFAVACARPQITDGKIRFGALGELKTTSATLQQEASPARDENDVCGDDEAFSGFTIGSGTNIDRLVSSCSSLSLASADAPPAAGS